MLFIKIAISIFGVLRTAKSSYKNFLYEIRSVIDRLKFYKNFLTYAIKIQILKIFGKREYVLDVLIDKLGCGI